MPQSIRFHLNEHLAHAIADGLRRRGIDVTTTYETGLSAASDEEQLAFARSHDRILVTRDADFLRLHQSGRRHAGIVYVRQRGRSVGEIIRGLVLLWELLTPEEMQNHVEFL